MKEYEQLLVVQYNHFDSSIRYFLIDDQDIINSVSHGDHLNSDEAEFGLLTAIDAEKEHTKFPISLIKDINKLNVVQLYIY